MVRVTRFPRPAVSSRVAGTWFPGRCLSLLCIVGMLFLRVKWKSSRAEGISLLFASFAT